VQTVGELITAANWPSIGMSTAGDSVTPPDSLTRPTRSRRRQAVSVKRWTSILTGPNNEQFVPVEAAPVIARGAP
jgi:hypothetical protein